MRLLCSACRRRGTKQPISRCGNLLLSLSADAHSACVTPLLKAGKVFASRIIPATIGVAVLSVLIAYFYMTCCSGGTAFGDLPTPAHVWAWLSVGFKSFDLSTDWGFFFHSVRGATFERVYRFDGHSPSATRSYAERRHDSNVVAFQFAVMFFCTIGTMLTFFDFFGSYRRMKGAVGSDAKASFWITLSVILFEDVPQLVFVVVYLVTITQKQVGEVDAIAIVSLAASGLNILFQVFLLFKDVKASKQEKPKVVQNDAGFGFGTVPDNAV